MNQLLLTYLLFALLATQASAEDLRPPSPSRSYLNFCASCHGDSGDGLGKAARFLYPKPRSLTDHPLQYSTNINRVASREDIEHVIRKGIPNGSMGGWSTLTDLQIDTLVSDVLEFRRYGAVKRYFDLLVTTGDLQEPNPQKLTNQQKDELSKYVQRETQSDEQWQFSLSVPGENALTLGRQLYFQQNCHKCHGKDGRGSYGIDLIGEYGFPTFARDLVFEPYKHGASATDIARVIKLGINGTKMPASVTLDDKQLANLTRYVISLQDPKPPSLTNAERYQRAIGNLDKTP